MFNTFHEQMKKARIENKDFISFDVFPNDKWTIQDYKDFFWCVDEGYLVQASFKSSFIINEYWEREDVYAIEFD